MASTHLSVGLAFLAGLVSFVSPCVLPLVPAYLSLLTGTSVEELRADAKARVRMHTLAHALSFILGFTLVFVALGATASTLGTTLRDHQLLIAKIGGVIVIVLGLQMMGVFRFAFLMRDARMHVAQPQRSYWASGLVGLAFAAGWSPCIGPILAAIYVLATETKTVGAGAFLLFVYALGLAVPFFITALALDAVLPWLNRIKRFLPAIEFASGAFLILVGLVLFNDAFLRIAGWFYHFVPQPQL
ncbi:MAG: cytochrome c biogenesis CcdA family protein [Vulcanimicrobiaceae bacterium]